MLFSLKRAGDELQGRPWRRRAAGAREVSLFAKITSQNLIIQGRKITEDYIEFFSNKINTERSEMEKALKKRGRKKNRTK